jgi:hypothetical protein
VVTVAEAEVAGDLPVAERGAWVLGETVGLTTVLGGAAALASCVLILGGDARTARSAERLPAGAVPRQPSASTAASWQSRFVAAAPAVAARLVDAPGAADVAAGRTRRFRPRRARARVAVVQPAGRALPARQRSGPRARALRPPTRR